MLKTCKLLLLILCALPCLTRAQIKDSAIEKMLVKKVVDPWEIYYNALDLVPRLYTQNKIDTLDALLDYCRSKSASGIELYAFDIVRRIKEGRFAEDQVYRPMLRYTGSLTDKQYYEQNIFHELYWYQVDLGNSRRGAFSNEDLNTLYDTYFKFLQGLAVSTLSKPGLTNVERLLLQYYINPSDTLFDRIKAPEFEGTTLKRAWKEYHKVHDGVTGNEFGLIAGTWTPTGNLAVMGTHPTYGYFGGLRGNKFTIGGELCIRFIHTPEKYLVPVNNNMYSTDNFLDAYIGLSGGFQLFRTRRNELDAVAGAAYEGFDAFKSGSNGSGNDNPSKSFATLNTNFGLQYRYYLFHRVKENWAHHVYVALQVKYNLLNFDNPGGTNLQGNAWTINAMIGSIDRNSRKKKSPKMKTQGSKDVYSD